MLLYTRHKIFTIDIDDLDITLTCDDIKFMDAVEEADDDGFGSEYKDICNVEVSKISIQFNFNDSLSDFFHVSELKNNIEDIAGIYFDEDELHSCLQFIKKHPEVPKTMYHFDHKLTFYCPSTSAIKIDDITQVESVAEIKFIHK